MFRFLLKETDEYDRLEEFMKAAGLEFSNDDDFDTERVKAWKVVQEPDYLVGGLFLCKRKGYFYINGIAVDLPMRKTGIGTIMMKKAIKEVRTLGGSEIWLVAKVPEFFRTLGFENVDAKDAPQIFGCLSCPQFGNGCKPVIMKLDI